MMTIDYHYRTLQSKSITSNKTRWVTLNIGKKTSKKTKKHDDIPVGEWLASPLNASKCDDYKHTQQSFYDEKVKILAPSASNASFITYSSTTTLPQHIQYYFASLSISSSLQASQKIHDQKGTPTPLMSIGEQENNVITEGSDRKNTDFCCPYTTMCSQVYNKDDFYDQVLAH